MIVEPAGRHEQRHAALTRLSEGRRGEHEGYEEQERAFRMRYGIGALLAGCAALTVSTLPPSRLGERFEPPRLLRKMVESGTLGKKSGRGFYDWEAP